MIEWVPVATAAGKLAGLLGRGTPAARLQADIANNQALLERMADRPGLEPAIREIELLILHQAQGLRRLESDAVQKKRSWDTFFGALVATLVFAGAAYGTWLPGWTWLRVVSIVLAVPAAFCALFAVYYLLVPTEVKPTEAPADSARTEGIPS